MIGDDARELFHIAVRRRDRITARGR
jgi:hypothetical protein